MALALFPAALALSASACAPSAELTEIPTIGIEPGGFEIEIKGFGELEAAKATPVEVPSNLPGGQRVVSLLEDGERIEEGELIARLDGEYLHRRIKRSEDAIRRIEYQLTSKQKALDKERRSLEASLAQLRQEKADAETYAPRDDALYSRHEIIDAQVDLELLETKIELAEAKLQRYTQRAEAELEIFRLQRRTQEVRLAQLKEARSALEVRAPHRGVFFRYTNWRGEKMSVGNTVWRGSTLGELPDLSRMEAKLHILESEAAGIAEGLGVELVLDAHPERRFSGTVSAIQPIANPIERNSPVKYFELKVSLDHTDPERMKPRSQVLASIYVTRTEDVFSIPNQALFQEAGESWVWVRGDGGFERRAVQTGQRSLSRTLVTEGLDAGDVIALSEPAGEGEAF